MANSRDFTGKNRKFTGTKGVVMPKGSTAERADTESGEIRFNTTTELMEYYDGNQWKPIDAPPTISTITTSDATGTNNILNADGSTLYTITINGGNFSLSPVVKFIGNTGTEYAAGNINRVSNSQITCTTLSNMGTSDDPYDVQVINTSGLSATLDDAFSFNAAPVFVNASGQLGTVFDGQTISGTTLNAGATDAEGNTITFSIISGSLPGSGLTLSSSTGAITGTLGGTPSLGNYSFVVRAATTEGTVERQFSIEVVAIPFITATGGTITTDGDFKVHTFTSPGTFTVTNAGGPTGSNSVNYLVVAGGAGGGTDRAGGGGAGGFRTNFPSPATAGLPVTATSYPISVGSGGGGGTGADGPGENGADGNPSTFSTITSTGGGGGSGGNAGGGGTQNGRPGGSGGGASHCSSTGFTTTGGSGNTPPTSPSQGNKGGDTNSNQASGCGAGGGGAGAVGANVSPGSDAGASGGDGTASSITGSSVTRAGGGGGTGLGGNGSGGPGGGGAGGSAAGNPGSPNTGGGGGGGRNDSEGGGSGGSGIVIIRYKFQ